MTEVLQMQASTWVPSDPAGCLGEWGHLLNPQEQQHSPSESAHVDNSWLLESFREAQRALSNDAQSGSEDPAHA